MLTIEMDSPQSNFPMFAAMDCMRRNANNRTLFSFKEQTEARTVADLLDTAYSCKIDINYRKKFIAVKMHNPVVRDRKFARKLDIIFSEKKYMTKVVTPQGVVYRLNFN